MMRGDTFKNLLENAEAEGFTHLQDAGYSPSHITDIFAVSDGGESPWNVCLYSATQLLSNNRKGHRHP